MLSEYRAFLESELALLGNASHHAYSLGQANMAKRALERLDEDRGRGAVVELALAEASEALTAIELLRERGALPPALEALGERIAAASAPAGGPSGGVRTAVADASGGSPGA